MKVGFLEWKVMTSVLMKSMKTLSHLAQTRYLFQRKQSH